MSFVLEGLQRVRNDIGDGCDFEEAEIILKEMLVNYENLKIMQTATGRLAEILRTSERNIEKILSEDRVIYPQPEFGISTFTSLSHHEKLMPFERREDGKDEKLDEEVLL